jgi:hypothetical protein
MFAQEDAYREYMDKFFATSPNTTISWIHDLGSPRHGAAAAALLLDAEQATNLEAKHVSLSLEFFDVNPWSCNEVHAQRRQAFTTSTATRDRCPLG